MVRDVLLGLVLIPASLLFILGGNSSVAWLLYGTRRPVRPLPFSIFVTLLYLRVRRLVPFAIAHALMDGASVLIGAVLPLLRS